MQGRDNEPKYITYVIEHICRVRNIEKEDLIRAAGENYRRLMGE